MASNEEKEIEIDYTVLTKLPPESSLHIEVYYKREKLEYDVQVIDEIDGGLLITPIMNEGKMINFMSPQLRILVTYQIKGDKPILWNRCQIKGVMYKGKPYHFIKTKYQGMSWNRRNDFRLFLGVEGVAQMGENHVALEVIVKDISSSGFSVVAPRDVADSDTHCRVHLVFRDEENDKQFSLFGIVVRKVELGNGRMLFGCRMEKENMSLSRYIAKRQRQAVMGKDDKKPEQNSKK